MPHARSSATYLAALTALDRRKQLPKPIATTIYSKGLWNPQYRQFKGEYPQTVVTGYQSWALLGDVEDWKR